MYWTPGEIGRLKNNWYDLPKQQLVLLLPNRSIKSIERKAERMNLKRYRPVPRQVEGIPKWLEGELLGDGCKD